MATTCSEGEAAPERFSAQEVIAPRGECRLQLAGLLVSVMFLTTACSGQTHRSGAAPCRMSSGDAEWSDGTLAAWELARSSILNVEPTREQPVTIFFDATCSFQREGGNQQQGAPHNGAVVLPDGNRLPPRVASFAAPYDRDRRAFVAMALPTIWAADRVESAFGLETLMTAVLVHELTHTRQFYHFAPRLAEATARYQLPDDLDDDAVQTRFDAVGEFASQIDAERDLLFAAAASSDDSRARDLTREAKMRIDARRAAHFVGNDVKYAELEELFLTMEGVAQWVSYRWLTHPRGGARPDDTATLRLFRRGGRRWSQDEGLALFLVIDRLVPDWRQRAFADSPAGASHLLAMAAQ